MERYTYPRKYNYFPRNNSCPYINEFISNPDLPKETDHASCKDFYLYKLSYQFFNKLITKGTKSLREYLSLGPKTTTEGFLNINNYRYLKIENTKFKKHIYANSMVKMYTEVNNGGTFLNKLKVSNLYPNYRKENVGNAGSFYFQGSRKHDFGIMNSEFEKTVSRIKGGILTYSTTSTDK